MHPVKTPQKWDFMGPSMPPIGPKIKQENRNEGVYDRRHWQEMEQAEIVLGAPVGNPLPNEDEAKGREEAVNTRHGHVSDSVSAAFLPIWEFAEVGRPCFPRQEKNQPEHARNAAPLGGLSQVRR